MRGYSYITFPNTDCIKNPSFILALAAGQYDVISFVDQLFYDQLLIIYTELILIDLFNIIFIYNQSLCSVNWLITVVLGVIWHAL